MPPPCPRRRSPVTEPFQLRTTPNQSFPVFQGLDCVVDTVLAPIGLIGAPVHHSGVAATIRMCPAYFATAAGDWSFSALAYTAPAFITPYVHFPTASRERMCLIHLTTSQSSTMLRTSSNFSLPLRFTFASASFSISFPLFKWAN